MYTDGFLTLQIHVFSPTVSAHTVPMRRGKTQVFPQFLYELDFFQVNNLSQVNSLCPLDHEILAPYDPGYGPASVSL